MGIGIGYYAYALFIAGLVCGVAIIFKVLFSDVKTQRKILEEQESKIIQLYTSVETLMEEFDDQVKMISAELKEHEYKTTSQMTVFDLPPELEKREHILDKLPRTLPLDANRRKAAGEVLDRAERIIKGDAAASAVQNVNIPTLKEENGGAVFQKFFDDSADALPPTVAARTASTQTSNVQSRSETILALAGEGKNDAEIASELGITRNEVQLVTALKR